MEYLWDSHDQANMLMATFFVGEIPTRCHFFRDDEVENDIDPQKITSYAVHQQLMDYLTRLSQALGKEVVLTPENDTPASCSPHWVWHRCLLSMASRYEFIHIGLILRVINPSCGVVGHKKVCSAEQQ